MCSPRFLLVIIGTFVPFSAVVAAESTQKPEAITDLEAAGADFAIQGEYVGQNCAAQVVALGSGKFRIVGWRAGLPGAQPEAERVIEVDAGSTGDEVAFESEEWRGKIAAGELTGTSSEGASWTLKRSQRTSPTLGAKPPEGAIVLFAGNSSEAWVGGKLSANGFLESGTKSKQAFGNCFLHIEFRTPFKPFGRGQDRGNSGVYLQDRYEVQILDSFGLKGENNECGGIYSVAKPKVNMCFPPLSWQTYDIDFEAAKFDSAGNKVKNAVITVRHNGILVHDRVEIPKATPSAGRPEAPGPGPLQLQNHGNPVVYRNIWVIERE